MGTTWASQVVEAMRSERAGAAAPQLSARLSRWYEGFALRWPSVRVDPTCFAAALVRVLDDPSGGDAEGQLDGLHAEDLLLACAASSGDEQAVRGLGEIFEGELDKALRRFSVDADTRAELAQLAREHVLVGRGERAAALTGYSGRGSLRAFLRVGATRACLNALDREQRGARRRQGDDDLLAALPSPAVEPELAHVRTLYAAEFKASFAAGLAILSPRQRTLLRQHYFDGLQPGELGELYGVHRTTAFRWLEQAHADLVDACRRALAERLGSSPAEAESLIRVLASQLSMSLERHLEGA